MRGVQLPAPAAPQARGRPDEDAPSVHEERCEPGNIQMHASQRTAPILSFAELLAREPVLATSNEGPEAHDMSDYCMHALRLMHAILATLRETGLRPGVRPATSEDQPMVDDERAALRRLRATWFEHLRAHSHALWIAPPLSGGATARYSLAVQLWLMIAHANCLLQVGDDINELFDFNPCESAYLSRNALALENAPVMSYPLRTLELALSHFAHSLDTLDRYERDYLRYADALQHRLSEVLCNAARPNEYNARELCVPHVDEEKQFLARVNASSVRTGDEQDAIDAQLDVDARAQAQGSALGEAEQGYERVSDQFMQYSFVWLLTIYNYADAYMEVHYTTYVLARRIRRVPVRVPAHRVAVASWVPSARTARRITAFFCQYAHSLVDDVYRHALRDFLLQFELRPSDTELYRLLNNTHRVHMSSVVQTEFRRHSKVARTYVRNIKYARAPHEYIVEALQWRDGAPHNTRSAELLRQRTERQCAIFWLIHQYMQATYRLNWKQRFLLWHRDPAFVTTMHKARTFRHPIIVQQYRRFTVLVPHRRAPAHDIGYVLFARRRARAMRAGLPIPGAAPPDVPEDRNYARHLRAYDCTDALDAFAVWATWFLTLCDARVDSKISLKSLLIELLGYAPRSQ